MCILIRVLHWAFYITSATPLTLGTASIFNAPSRYSADIYEQNRLQRCSVECLFLAWHECA